MNNIYDEYASSLQSRLARRSHVITENEMWAKGYKALKRRTQLAETKMTLVNLRAEQRMDKKLLNVMQNMAWEIRESDKWITSLLAEEFA